MDDFTTPIAAVTVPESGTHVMSGIGLLALVAGGPGLAR
jgi:hypothetical protein